MTTPRTSLNLTKLVGTQASSGDDLLKYIEYTSPAASLLVGTPGLVFNIINTVIFLRLGVRDCMSLCLFSLSLTDNASLVFGLMAALTRMTNSITTTAATFLYLDPLSVWVLLVQGQFCFYDLSTYTTVFISIERCACVVLPFRFKDLFTFKRSILFLILIYASTFLLYVFFFAFAEIRPILDPRTNTTRLFLWSSPRKRTVEDYLQPLNNIILAALSLALILITSGIMVMGLSKAARFQEKSNAHVLKTQRVNKAYSKSFPETSHINSENTSFGYAELEPRPEKGATMDEVVGDLSKTESLGIYKEKSKVNNKNFRLARMVTVLAIITFICNAVRFGVMVALYVNPDFRVVAKINLTVHIISGVVFITQVVNCSVNTVVYLTCNSSYMRAFKKLFRLN